MIAPLPWALSICVRAVFSALSFELVWILRAIAVCLRRVRVNEEVQSKIRDPNRKRKGLARDET